MQKYDEDLEENLENKLKPIVEKLYFRLRNEFVHGLIVEVNDYYEFRELFNPRRLIEDLLKSSNYEKVLQNRVDFLKKELSNEELEKFLPYFKKMKDTLSQPNDVNKIRKRALEKVFVSEFYNEILLKGKEKGNIQISEFDKEIFNIKIIRNGIDNFHFSDELYFTDATYIETPLIVNYSNLIENAKTFLDIKLYGKGIPTTSLHSKDLINKLIEIPFFKNTFFSINEIITGEFIYDKDIGDFVLKKGNKIYKNFNIATGIKSFGILDILIKNGFINEKSLLIIDEPEVHLHPKWQVEYAKLLVNLVKNGINILVTSHSPYMIEALDIFAKKEKISLFSYYANNGVIEEDTNFNKSISKLVEPMKELRELRYE
jgi:hypothetical protein